MTDNNPDQPMTKTDREALIRVAKGRARQAEREADMREKTLLAEVQDQLTAEFDRHNQLWAEAVTIADEAAAKANAQIQAQCADLGIPPKHSPRLHLMWQSRSSEYTDKNRRSELIKLAVTRLAALKQEAKTVIRANALDAEERLILGGLQSGEAKEFFAALPTVEQLMPSLSLDDLGVKRWQPPEDAATQLTTPLTPADRRRRRVLRAIEANPGASDRAIAQIASCDHKTVAAYRHERGEFPAIGGESPTEGAPS